MYRFRIFSKGKVRLWPLPDSVVLIGSGADCDLVLEGADIPPLALRLSLTGDSFRADSLDPKAKPIFNAKRADAAEVRTGDLIELGATRILIEKDADGGDKSVGADPALSSEGAVPPGLARLCALVAEERDLESLLRQVMRLSLEAFRGDEALLFTLDAGGKPAVAVSTRDAVEPLFSDTVVAKVLSEGKGMYLANALEDPEYGRSQSVVDLKLRSVMCCPLLTAGRLSGVVYIGSNRPSVSFGPQALAELEVFALVAGSLLDHVAALGMQGKLLAALGPQGEDPGFISTCPPMRAAVSEARAVAGSEISVLIEGETGTGKDLIAQYIHRRSARAGKPFLVVNCSTLRGDILASELFGHRKGAFTGAVNDQRGIFQSADGGTLFLDEIGEMDLPLQSMLLRVLETGMVRPVGQSTETRVDVRILSATNRKLKQRVAEGAFREDLYYRINQHRITLPPLRDRGEDLALLAHFFLEKAKARYPEKRLAGFDPETLFALARYRWPGNVRELANAVAKAALFADGSRLRMELPGGEDQFLDLEGATRRFQRDYMQRAMDVCGGDKEKAASLLGIGRSTFFRYLAEAREGENGQPG
ncbi:MAG: sigma 54-interacting transcriptional regulator [Fibrobacteres bacterium]|nr:sigma 54-interacting transcriptional regulator [Fibrobacterota bacterium]